MNNRKKLKRLGIELDTELETRGETPRAAKLRIQITIETDAVTRAMFEAGGGSWVNITSTAHVLRKDKTFLKMVGLDRDCLGDEFLKLCDLVRAAMERQGPLTERLGAAPTRRKKEARHVK